MMGTIASNLTKLAETKSAIKQAIVDKGVKVADTDTFASYAEKIGKIRTAEKKTLVAKDRMSFQYWAQEAIDSFDITRLDTSSMTRMDSMFSGCAATSLDVSNFDTSKVTRMDSMFSGCAATSLDVSNFDTSKVTNMGNMFYSCAVTSLDLSMWNTSKVTTMAYIFTSCGKITKIDMHGLDMSNATNTWHAINGCSNLVWADLTGWNLSKDTSTEPINNCPKLTTIIGDHTIEEVEAGEVMTFMGYAKSTKLNTTALERPSLLAVIKGLADLTESGTTQTLTLGSTLLAKLTDEDKKIATDKGWTLA